ncbi:helix-turn-helix transcriptional regulator [Halopiger goleimassiliensis]|uniref:helix-turn-helix transcriptional regulator n=1 Tax=Halopiger goleimassiliensis TaxID=1293048 RepID=UPI000677F206|nr:helix-turn-helix transcriptional regulator [Halopiger goleimassiliensis]
MRDNATNTESVLDELSKAASGDASDSHEPGGTDRTTDDVERELESLLEHVAETLPVEDVTLDERLVKENLDELLLVLIAMHEGTHGDELLTTIERAFETRLSPGTVYPRLHDLEEADVLSMHAKVRTKEYSIDDPEYVQDRLEETMIQHLAFGMLLYALHHRL